MRRAVSTSAFIAGLLVLAATSVGLKAAAARVNDGKDNARPFQLENQLIARLEAQHFATSLRPLKIQSPIVSASRGECRLSARDARAGTAIETVFGQQASSIGPVRYLYRGQISPTVPAGRLRFDRMQTELLAHLGISRPIPVVVALATSPACHGENFGLDDVRVD